MDSAGIIEAGIGGTEGNEDETEAGWIGVRWIGGLAVEPGRFQSGNEIDGSRRVIGNDENA
jgi:hypothetical protein